MLGHYLLPDGDVLMKSIWIGAWSVPVALLLWWVSADDREVAEAPEVRYVVQTGSPTGPGLTNEFDGAPGTWRPSAPTWWRRRRACSCAP